MNQLKVGSGFADCLMCEIQVTKDCGIVNLSDQCTNKELTRTFSVPLTVPFPSIDVCSASHQQERPHHSYHQHDSGLVLMYVNDILYTDSLYVEMVGEPPKDHKHRTRDCRGSEEYVLGVVVSNIRDPCMWEGFVVAVVLADPVDQYQCEDSENCRNLEVDSCRVFAEDHSLK